MPAEIATLADLLTRLDFWSGLIVGAILLAVLVLVPIWDGRPGWGLAMTVASLVGVHVTIGRRLGLTVALLLMALGGWVLDGQRADSDTSKRPAKQTALAWVLIGVGSVLLMERSGLPDTLWIRYWTPIAAVLGGLGLSHMERSSLRRYLGPLFLMTATGIWLTVPDTREARVLLGASIPLALATLPDIKGRLTRAGSFALSGLVSWVVATGGQGRHASIVGAWACLGILLVLPVAKRLRDRPMDPGRATLFVGHGVLVLVASRIVGMWEQGGPAAMALLVVGVLAVTLLSLLPSEVVPHRE